MDTVTLGRVLFLLTVNLLGSIEQCLNRRKNSRQFPFYVSDYSSQVGAKLPRLFLGTSSWASCCIATLFEQGLLANSHYRFVVVSLDAGLPGPTLVALYRRAWHRWERQLPSLARSYPH